MSNRHTHTKQASKQPTNQSTNEFKNKKQSRQVSKKTTKQASKQLDNQTMKQSKTNNSVPSQYILFLPLFLLRFMTLISWKEYMESARKKNLLTL